MSKRTKGILLVALGLLAGRVQADVTATAAPQAATEAVQATAPAAASTAQTAVSADDAFNFFLQEAQVVTASRRAQKKSDSPVAIDVITREEIEHSGARTVPELLRFKMGVNVVEGSSIQGNPTEVNLRGIPSELSQDLQVLIDGRSVVSLATSGVNWATLPVTLDDIERIEIVRGPNSALFGANSGQGVINIITKKPGSGSSARAEAGTLGKKLDYASLDTGDDTLAVRGSYQESVNGSSLTPQGNLPAVGASNQTTDDEHINLRAIGNFWKGGELDLSAGRLTEDYNFPSSYGVTGALSERDDFQMLKLTQTLNDSFSLEAMAARRQDGQIGYFAGTETVYDGDLLLRASLLDGKSQTVLGTSYREGEDRYASYFSDSSSSPTLYAYTRSTDETVESQHQTRAYLSEQMAFLDWFSVALAGSYEGSDTGGEQAAYQGALIFKPADDGSLRLSASHSPTTPSLQNKYDRVELLVPVSTGVVYATRVEGSNITPPQVSSYEATLDWAFFERRINFEITGFQMEIGGYPDFVSEGSVNIAGSGSDPFKTGTLSDYQNVYDLVMRGTETALTFKPTLGTTIQVNHTYEDVQTNKISPSYAYTTPWNVVNLTVSTDLPWGFNLGGGVNWQGQHNAYLASRQSTLAIPDQAAVDLRMGYRPIKDVELYAVGLNLDHAYRTESPDGLTQDQSYVGGVNISWGGSSK